MAQLNFGGTTETVVIRDEFPSLAINSIWNLAESFLMIIMLPVFFPALHRTVNCRCCYSLPIRQK